MGFYILHTGLLLMILLFIIAIICYHYARHRSEQKNVLLQQQYKLENNEFEKVSIKNWTRYYFHDIIKFEDFDSDKILLNEKQYYNNLAYNISYKTLIGSKPLRIRFNKID